MYQKEFNKYQAKYEQKLHDEEAKFYDETIIPRYGPKTELIVEDWANYCVGLCLDYGCGTGQVSTVLVRKGCKVIGMDISHESLIINRIKNNIPVVQGDAFHLPFVDSAFKTTCINGVLHHIVDLESAFDEIDRVTEEYLLISESCTSEYLPNITRIINIVDCISSKIYRIVKQNILRKSLPICLPSKYERRLDPEEIATLLRNHNFEIIKQQFYINMPFEFLISKNLRRYLCKKLISNDKGTHVTIIGRRNRANNK